MNDPKINPDQATLIDPARLLAASQEAASKIEDEKRQREERDYWERWDRAGTRAFKGIMPRPWRLMMLKSALRRLEREQEAEGE
jgi:hypothetical protein